MLLRATNKTAMLSIILLSSLLCLIRVDAQGLLSGLSGIRGQQSPIDRLPGLGACDRIASRGVANCMENFLPRNVLSGITGGPRGGSGGDVCCSYSKYRACISGLHDGLRIAMQRERCPKSYSTRIIKSLGDSSVGLPIRSLCENASTGKSQCPKNKQQAKPKKNKNKQTSNRRTSNRGREEEEGLGGLNPLGGGGLNPLGGGGFNPLGGGGLNPLGGGGFNPLGGGGLGGFNPLGGGLIPSGSNPARDIFGGSNRRTDGGEREDALEPVRNAFQRGTETVQHGVSSLFGGVQNVFDGISGGLNGGGSTRNRGSLDRFN